VVSDTISDLGIAASDRLSLAATTVCSNQPSLVLRSVQRDDAAGQVAPLGTSPARAGDDLG